MPNSTVPLLVSRRLLTAFITWCYLWGTVAGIAVLTYPPRTYIGTDLIITVAWGVILLASSTIAVIGVLTRRYALEWAACYAIAAGIALYAYLSWGSVPGSLGSIPRAAILTGVIGVPLARGTSLAIEDYMARTAKIARRGGREASERDANG